MSGLLPLSPPPWAPTVSPETGKRPVTREACGAHSHSGMPARTGTRAQTARVLQIRNVDIPAGGWLSPEYLPPAHSAVCAQTPSGQREVTAGRLREHGHIVLMSCAPASTSSSIKTFTR